MAWLEDWEDEQYELERMRLDYEDYAIELPQDPTGIDCIERYEGGDE